jgi:hypothetical protein
MLPIPLILTLFFRSNFLFRINLQNPVESIPKPPKYPVIVYPYVCTYQKSARWASFSTGIQNSTTTVGVTMRNYGL